MVLGLFAGGDEAPRLVAVLSPKMVRWVVANCKHMRGDPDSWPYTADFHVLGNAFNRHFDLGMHPREFYYHCEWLAHERSKTNAHPAHAKYRMSYSAGRTDAYDLFEEGKAREADLIEVVSLRADGKNGRGGRHWRSLAYTDDFHDNICPRYECSREDVWRNVVRLGKRHPTAFRNVNGVVPAKHKKHPRPLTPGGLVGFKKTRGE